MVRELADVPTRRSGVLERAAATTGEAWARGWLDELRSEGRAAAGGWPGTMTQARSRVRPRLVTDLARERLEGLTVVELESAARATYAQARDVWLSAAKADEPDEVVSGDAIR